MGHNYIGTEHILLSVLEQRTARACLTGLRSGKDATAAQ